MVKLWETDQDCLEISGTLKLVVTNDICKSILERSQHALTVKLSVSMNIGIHNEPRINLNALPTLEYANTVKKKKIVREKKIGNYQAANI